jgi:hypothetical protein
MPFQQTVNIQPAPAVVGDFASANPRTSVLAGPGQLVAGPAGLIVGRFAWVDSTYTLANNNGTGLPAGFVGRQGNTAMITIFLAETSMIVPSGIFCTLYNEGEFWVVNSGANEVLPNQKAYAQYGTGLVTFGATGTPPATSSVTGAVTAGTGSATASISGNLMTIPGAVTGSMNVGGILSGTNVVTGTTITSQVSGTANGTGIYTVSIPQTVASTTISETHGILTVTVAGANPLVVGDVLSGGTIAAGTTITAFGTGAGGLGTYILSNNTTSSSGTVAATSGIETKWLSGSFAAAGELVKMTSWPQG